MPTSATGTADFEPCRRVMTVVRTCRRSSCGFTLLELLVVLVLIGIITSFAVLSIGDGGRQERLKQEAQRIQAVFSLAGEEAVLCSLELGVLLQRRGYGFVTYNGESWEPIADDDMFRDYTLSVDAELSLFMDGLEVGLDALPDDEEDAITPQVIFFSSGERTPFELVLAYLDGQPLAYRLQAPLMGPMQLEQVESAF